MDLVNNPRENPVMQDVAWYYSVYETTPSWYKKFGHILKIMKGRKDWRSVFSKKYKNDPLKLTGIQWYVKEYDSLPGWYKKFGKFIKHREKS